MFSFVTAKSSKRPILIVLEISQPITNNPLCTKKVTKKKERKLQHTAFSGHAVTLKNHSYIATHVMSPIKEQGEIILSA